MCRSIFPPKYLLVDSILTHETALNVFIVSEWIVPCPVYMIKSVRYRICTGCEPKVSGLGQFNNFKHNLIIDKCIVPFGMVSFGVYTLGLEASLELLFHDAFEHHLWLCFSLQCLGIFIS
jgi:hypothetical protein